MTSISVKQQTRAGTGNGGTAAVVHSPDVVYVVRPGEDNHDLRYSLRSLENLPHNNVFVAGYVPLWLKDIIPVPRNQEGQSDQENANGNLLAAIKHPLLSENFIYMNDDFFILEKMLKLPSLRQGLLDDTINNYKKGDRFGQAYSLIATRHELRKMSPGQKLYSYELHTPMLFNKEKLQDMFDLWPRPLLALRPRTMYGNLYHIEGEEIKDVKKTSGEKSAFISTVYGETGDAAHRVIYESFGTPSRYESRSN